MKALGSETEKCGISEYTYAMSIMWSPKGIQTTYSLNHSRLSSHPRYSTTLWVNGNLLPTSSPSTVIQSELNFKPATYLLLVLMVLVGIAATPPSNGLCLVAYSVGVVSIMTWRRVPWGKILKRVAIEFSFLSLVLVSSLWQSSGDILWQWGALQITVGGLTIMMGIFAKALLSLLLINALQQRLTLPQFLSALRYVRVPSLLVATMGFMLRYISILQSEFHQMRSAAIARNGFVSPASTRRTIAQIISGGFIRTLSRGETVHRAMMARGYTGTLLSSLHPPLQPIDYGAVITTALLTLLPHVLLR